MQHGVEGRAIGVSGHLADRRLDREARHPLDQILARLPIGDQLGDRDALEAVLGGESLDLRPTITVPSSWRVRRSPHRLEGGEAAEIDRRLVWPERISTPPRARSAGRRGRADEVARAHVGIGERAHGVAALLAEIRSSCRA